MNSGIDGPTGLAHLSTREQREQERDVVPYAEHLEGAQPGRGALDGVRSSPGVRDELGQHRIVVLGDHQAFADAGVHADAFAGGFAIPQQTA